MELALHVCIQGWWHRVSQCWEHHSGTITVVRGAIFPAISQIPSLNQYLEELLVLAVSSPVG